MSAHGEASPEQPARWHERWRRRLGLERGAGALAAGLFVYGFGEELWFRYLPALLRFLGASAFTVGAFGTLKDLLDAAYAYPGGWLTDRLGSRRALLPSGVTMIGRAMPQSAVTSIWIGCSAPPRHLAELVILRVLEPARRHSRPARGALQGGSAPKSAERAVTLQQIRRCAHLSPLI